MTWEHIFQAFYISFSDSYLVHEMCLRPKGTYAPPQDKARGLWQMSLWPHMINKLAIQTQIKHKQATKTCHDHIKAFTHERAYK
jgi:hypothetical protein